MRDLSSSSSSVAKDTCRDADSAPTGISLSREVSGPQLEKDLRPRTPRSEKGGSQQDASAMDDNVRKITGVRWCLICLAVYVTALMYGLDTTIAADVQGAVIEAFGDASQLAWVGAGFPLGSVAVILPYGTLYTKFDMKWLYIAGIVLFEVGSALCGAAPRMNALIVGRVLAGAGGTGIYLGVLNILTALTTREERGPYIAGIGFVWGLGAILGPVVGGGFSVSSATWRWGFYINLIIGAVSAPVYLFCLPSIRPDSAEPTRERVGNLDFVGFVLSAGLWVAFAMSLISAGGIWPWNDGRTIATLVVFGVIFITFAIQQYFCIFTTPANRSFPGHLLRSRTQVLLYIQTSCAITSLFVTTYYIPIYFQFVENDTALMAAVRLLPFVLVTITVNLLSGFLLSKLKYYMPVYLVSGLFITLAGSLFYVYMHAGTTSGQLYGFSVLMAVGAGLSQNIGYTVATLTVRPVDVIHSISIQNVSQVGSTAICLVLAGQIFQSVAVNNLTAVLAGHGYSAEEIHNAIAGAQSALFEELSGDLRTAAIGAITGAIQKSFVLVIVAGALEVVVSLFMKRERLFGEVVIA